MAGLSLLRERRSRTRPRQRLFRPSAPLPKFVIHRSTFSHELRKQRGTSNSMILVPLFDLKFLTEFAATAVGTSNRRHSNAATRSSQRGKSKRMRRGRTHLSAGGDG